MWRGSDGPKLIGSLDSERRATVTGLLVVRYCGFSKSAHFGNDWQLAKAALDDAAITATTLVTSVASGDQAVALEELAGTREVLAEALEAIDPDGPPFESELADHLAFADEVFEGLQSGGLDAILQVFDRADELAESVDGSMAEIADSLRLDLEKAFEPAGRGFAQMQAWEADLVRTSVEAVQAADFASRSSEVLSRSRQFADLYGRALDTITEDWKQQSGWYAR